MVNPLKGTDCNVIPMSLQQAPQGVCAPRGAFTSFNNYYLSVLDSSNHGSSHFGKNTCCNTCSVKTVEDRSAGLIPAFYNYAIFVHNGILVLASLKKYTYSIPNYRCRIKSYIPLHNSYIYTLYR